MECDGNCGKFLPYHGSFIVEAGCAFCSHACKESFTGAWQEQTFWGPVSQRLSDMLRAQSLAPTARDAGQQRYSYTGVPCCATPIECPVCMDAIPAASTATTQCGHKFCVGCLNTWRQTHASCPLCRGPL